MFFVRIDDSRVVQMAITQKNKELKVAIESNIVYMPGHGTHDYGAEKRLFMANMFQDGKLKLIDSDITAGDILATFSINHDRITKKEMEKLQDYINEAIR